MKLRMYLHPVNRDIGVGLKPQLDLAPFDFHYRDNDVVIDDNLFVQSTRKYKHMKTLLWFYYRNCSDQAFGEQEECHRSHRWNLCIPNGSKAVYAVLRRPAHANLLPQLLPQVN